MSVTFLTNHDKDDINAAIADKADKDHAHDYPVKSVNGMTGAVVIQAGGGGTDERIPQPTEADDGMPLRVENGEYKVGKLQKNAVEGLITDLIMYGDALSTLEQNALTEDDKADIVNDTLSALAGADTSDATIAALQSRCGVLETKVNNHSEAIAMLQEETDELEIYLVEYVYKMMMRLIRLERHLGLQPPVLDDGTSMETELDASYDDMPWAE